MATYSPPVSNLLKLGERKFGKEWDDYSAHGIGPSDVPELIRLMQDDELAHGPSDTPEVYAQVHAWRALGQLRTEQAIEPLLNLLAAQDDDSDWDDWLTEEVPQVLGRIGPAAFSAVEARLTTSAEKAWSSVYFVNALNEIAKQFPDTRQRAIDVIVRLLSNAKDNHPGLNGSLVADLLDYKATETWPVIEAAFATGNVDEMVVGDAADAKYELGLGPRPVGRRNRWFGGPPPRSTPKDRAADRAKKKKAEKRRKRKHGR